MLATIASSRYAGAIPHTPCVHKKQMAEESMQVNKLSKGTFSGMLSAKAFQISQSRPHSELKPLSGADLVGGVKN